jgi:hypothetical protein
METQLKTRPRKYSFNENYFENIDTESKAYWLGFIAADGSISKRKTGQNSFSLYLHEIEPLEALRKDLESDKPIYLQDNSKYENKYSNKMGYRITFISNKMVSDLETHGILERKTFKLKLPNLKKELYSHFVRGYFDGDGSVFYSKSRDKIDEILCVSICGTIDFLNQICNVANIDTKKIYKDTRKETDCYNLKLYNQTQALPFYQYIYSNINNSFYLKRKKDKFDNYINMKVQRLQSAILKYERIKV